MARHKSSRHKNHKQKSRKQKRRSSSPADSTNDNDSSGSENGASDAGSTPRVEVRKNEEELKAENRDAILKRSRMWQTVSSEDGSSDDDTGNGVDSANGRAGDREASSTSRRHRDEHDARGKHRSSREGEERGRRRRRSQGNLHDSSRKESRADGDGNKPSRGAGGRRKGEGDSDNESEDSNSESKSEGSSSGDSDGGSGGTDDSDSDSEEENERSRKRAHGGKHRDKKASDKKKRKEDQELDTSGRDRKHKKSRRSVSSRSKERKDKKRRRERSKDKKTTKKKKDRKRDKDKDREGSAKKGGSGGANNPKMMGAVDQNAFGKYGVLREADYFNKQREFEVWMAEQKKIYDTGSMPKWETKQYFRQYMEDFNTATLPHEKYINLEKWEVAEFNRKKANEAKKYALGDARTMKEDEIAMKQKRLKAKEESNKKFDNLIKKSITGDKLESMKSQDLLRAQMQLAYKQGDMETFKRIEKRLKPDEMEGWR